MYKIAEYQNGNTFVKIMNDGTKIREHEGTPNISHPESIDVKITNYCDNNCRYCHEMSTTNGIHGDLDMLLNVIKELPCGVELAIGGGNPLSHPYLISFLVELKKRGIISNITVNQAHLYQFNDLITYLIKDELIHGLGISITSLNFEYIKPILKLTDNVVFHLIAGINKIEIIDKLIQFEKCKILILGYKTFGFGIDYLNENIKTELGRWSKLLRKYIGVCTVSFDNLAIEQLNVRKLFTIEGWNKFYMGDDFCFTMYIDAVKQEYAPTSRSSNRKSFDEISLINYFISERGEKIK
jgi:hypothetical protein